MPGTRSNPGPTSAAAAPSPQPSAPPQPSGPGATPSPSRDTATFIPATLPLQDTPCFSTTATLGAAPSIDLKKVMWADNTFASDDDRLVVAHQVSMIANLLPGVPGEKTYLQVLQAASALERGRVGSQSFRTQGAKKMLVHHALAIVHHQGLLLESQGCVLLHGASEVQPKPAAQQPGAQLGAGSGTGAASAGAGSGPAAVQDLTGGGGGGAGVASKGKGRSSDTFTELLERPGTTTSDQQELLPLLRGLKATVRNTGPVRKTWAHLREGLTEAINLAETLCLEDERKALRDARLRGNHMMTAIATDPNSADYARCEADVLAVFTAALPNRQGVPESRLLSDLDSLKTVRKLNGHKNHSSGTPAVYTPTPAAAAAPASSYAGATMPQQYHVSLPLAGTAKPNGTKKTGGQQAAKPPLPPPSARERADIDTTNRQMQAAQQASTAPPGGQNCKNCARTGRNPNHVYHTCAFAICKRCTRAGHRPNKCPY